MNYLALDPSKRSTGYAVWQDGWDKPRHGHWRLGSEYTTDGGVFAKVHRCLNDLHALTKFEAIYFEQPIHPAQLSGATNIHTIRLAAGIAAHIESFAHAKRCRIVKSVNVQQWRPDFLGRMPINEANARARRLKKAGKKSASARDELKALTIERCRQLGCDPANDDEADAIAILTYAISLNGITPPWLRNEVLRPPLGIEVLA